MKGITLLARRMFTIVALGVLVLGTATAQTTGRIAFTSTRDNGWAQIYVMNADGSGQTNLSNTFLSQHNDDWAAFNRTGTKIAFVSDRTGSWNVFTMNADGSGQTQVTSFSGSGAAFMMEPAWSADGSKIVFVARQVFASNPTWEIYLISADDTGLKQLTSNPATSVSPGGDYGPAFSADGTRILFSRFVDPSGISGNGQYDFWTMSPDGNNQALFASGLGNPDPPSFSPSGKIAYGGNDLVTNLPNSPFPGTDISVMNADTTGQTIVTSGGSSNLRPSFSTDGTLIAFDSDRSQPAYPGGPSGGTEVYVMNADGTNVQQLTFSVPTPNGPSWSARPSFVPGTAAVTTPPTPTDSVAITRLEYGTSQRQLRIEATSTSLTVTLKAYATSTGALIGALTNVGGGKYQGQFVGIANPVSVTVISSGGGSATATVFVHN